MDPVLPSPSHEITPKINPQAAVSGLSNDHEVSPEDGTASVDVIRDIDNKLVKSGDMNVPERYSTAHPTEAEDFSLHANELDDKCPISDIESLEGLRDNPEDPRCTHLSQSLPDQNGVLYDDKNSMAVYAAGGVPEELVKAAANMLGNIEPGDFMKMLEIASSLNDKGASFDTVGEGSNSGMKIPEMTHEMAKIKFAGVSNEISPEDFQKMISLLYMNGMPSPRVIESSPRLENISGLSVAAGSSETRNPNAGESKSGVFLSDSGMGQSRLSIPIPDLSKANEVSHEDDIATDIIRNTSSVPRKDTGDANAPLQREEEALQTMATYDDSNSSSIAVAQPVEFGQCSQSANKSYPDTPKSDAECFQNLGGNAEASRLSQNDVFNCESDSLAALGTGGISAEIVKTATAMISNSEPEELQKMLEVAFSLNVKGPIFNTIGSPSGLGLDFPDISLEMVKMASERVSKMTTEELQRMLEVAPLVNMNVIFSPRPPSGGSTQRSKSCSEMSILEESSALGKSGSEKILSGSRLNSKMSQSSSSLSTQIVGFPENMRHLTNDPATQQMLTYMKDMSPKMMTSMSEQLGLKLPCGEAVEAQQTMSAVSEDDLDAMTLQDESDQGPETMEKTTIWFIGKAGLNLAICMMLVAFLFHKLGYIRG